MALTLHKKGHPVKIASSQRPMDPSGFQNALKV